MKITIAQLNPIVGDIEGNLARIISTLSKYSKDSPDLLVFPELFLVGYPPRDLLERKSFIDKVQNAIQELLDISTKYPQTGLLFGAPLPSNKKTGRGLYNAALLIYQGQTLMGQNKSLLPTYDVFDEARYFDSANEIFTVKFKGEILGISICEDMWNDPDLWPKRMYSNDPVGELAAKGATLLINISASPFHVGKEEIRYRIIQNHAKKHKLPFVFANQVGANDELIFDGRSLCLDGTGKPIIIFSPFREQVQTIDTRLSGTSGTYVPQDDIASVYDALVLGVRDYMRKCGFSKAVIGLSGGIDSALTCCLAKEAIGPENVLGVSMPSPYSSRGSVEDSRTLAENLGIEFKVIPISAVFSSYLKALQEHFNGWEADVTEENIQARIRGNILMAFSNKFGNLVLSTGNKSELAVGYCTLYGDMAGGLAVISDVPKTMVYKLAYYINEKSEAIPNAILEKQPSAELKPDQIDQDTLPPYDVLDQLLQCYIDESYTLKDLLKLPFDPEIIKWVVQSVDRNEYKRRQAAPGLRVTSKAFGMGRRMPIAAKY